MENGTKKLVSHDGSFHSDDIFAAAALSIYLDKLGEKYEIIRTRDQGLIDIGDYVFDVGGIYDEEKNRFDHHQVGGAGKRAVGGMGIEYSSFGLVWKKFGAEICGDTKVAELIEKKIVSPIDAADNGINLVEFKSDVAPYFIQNAFNSFIPGWKDASPETMYSGFLDCVKIAQNILSNEISRARGIREAEDIIYATYQNTSDKRIIILDKKYPWYEQMQNYPEPIYVVYPRLDGSWGAEGVAASKNSFENRKKFPGQWAGLRDEELQKITGVPDAVFCHRALFMSVAKSKEGAIKLAELALKDKLVPSA